jgi:DNA polymerase I-like protein with 3'-5' exonuclease and polymerase domains
MGKRRQVHPENGLHLDLFSPESNWRPPEFYPDLSGAKKIAIDLETRDPYLKQKGPGGVRGDGNIAGVCVATDTGFSGYFPIAHIGGGNMDPDTTLRWLNSIVKDPNQTKIGANFIYDLEWMAASGIEVKGPVHDVQIMEALLDEEGRYSLDHLSRKYIGIPKAEEQLRNAAAAFGVDPKKDLWKLHSKYVGAYGEGDASNTLRVYEKQIPLLQKEGLEKIWKLESDVTPILLKMRMQGVKVDLEAAEKLNKKLAADYVQGTNALGREIGFAFNPWKSEHLVKVCESRNIEYPRTAAGNPSFVKDWLENNDDELLKRVTKLRTLDRLRGTFIQKKIIDAAHNGRIHSQFHQMRGDEDGTRTGRFSSSNPNLQQVPSRDEMAPLIRGLFIPEDGDHWAKLDYSQQEPRIAVHYAYVCGYRGAAEAKAAYEAGEDFYDFITKAAGITRRQAKDLTLGRMYGMGDGTMADKLHCALTAARKILSTFDEYAPFLKKLAEKTEQIARQRGFIETIGGRHRHFNLYAPPDDWNAIGLSKGKAEAKWPNKKLERWGTRKALNSLIQGSAADMVKQAMVDIYNETGKIPLLSVHDENDYSVDGEPTAVKLKEISENGIDMEVPIVCDLDFGRSWK